MFDGQLRTKLFAVCGVIGVALLLAMFQFQTHRILVAKPVGQRNPNTYSQLRFTSSRTVVGVRQTARHLEIDRWKAGSDSIRRWSVDVGRSGRPAKVSVAPSLSHVAWTDGSTVWAQELDDGEQPGELAVRNRARILDVGLARDGRLLIAYADGTVERWDIDDGQMLRRFSLGLKDADQVVVDEDYIAAASPSERRLIVYRDVGSDQLRTVEEMACPPPPFDLLTPAQGSIALVTTNQLFIRGRAYNTPGRIRSLGFGFEGTLIGTGDYDGAYAIVDQDKSELVSGAVAGGIVASSDEFLVHSGNQGTRQFAFDIDRKSTATGKRISFVGLALMFTALFLLVDGYAVNLVRNVKRAGRKSATGVGKSFPAPPQRLVEALAMGEPVLWAGSGLSAQSGMPARRSFVRNLIEGASFERWLKGAEVRRLQDLCGRGLYEEAMEAMLGQPWDVRAAVLSYLQRDYGRTTVLSRSHQWLARIPFIGAVTTNYDSALEQIGDCWAEGVLHLQNINTAGPSTDFFLFKLYGDLNCTSSVLISRSELAAATKINPGLATAVRSLLESNTILFVGCSLEGLIADLDLLCPSKSSPLRHYACAVVTDGSWHRKASELKSRWGIQVLPCSEEGIHTALPEFLELLARKVAQRQDLPAILAAQER